MNHILLMIGLFSSVTSIVIAEETVNAPASTLNVLQFGAVADGITDNTAAFQKALDTAAAANGGIVAVPNGRYSFSGNLSIPRAVTLRGIFTYSPSHAGIRDNSDEKPVFGSVLLPRANAGKEDAPAFITLQTNATLEGVCIHYPDQLPDAQEPTPYPYAVAMRGNNPAIIDVELLNPYNGIDASSNQRALIRNVHGQPIHIGIFVDLIYDIGRIENVHWNPWWSLNTPVFKWQMEHGTGFVFAKTDWHYVLNTFCFGYNIGYQFLETKAGATNGNFLGIGADDCRTAVWIDESAPMGILITNGEFVSFDGPDPVMLRVGEHHSGTVRFSNCAFWGPCNQNAVIKGTGTIGFSDCTFVNWGHKGGDPCAMDIFGGNVLIRGCEFKENKPQIFLAKEVASAIITDNIFKGKKQIIDKAKGEIIIKNNVFLKVPRKKDAK